MTIWHDRDALAARQRLAREAWERAATLGDGWARRRYYHDAMPYHGPRGGTVLTVAVRWCPGLSQYYVATPYARTLVPTMADVDEILRMESEHPGWLEEMLTGKNSVKELDQAYEQARKKYKPSDVRDADAILDMF